MRAEAIRRVIRAYDNRIVRGYCWGRFWILRQRFLDEIGQYLPDRGKVLDVGCGFGLFSLYYAQVSPGASFRGLDLDERRIAMARGASEKLGISNVEYARGDATTYRAEDVYDAIYMMDVVHHVPRESVGRLIRELYRSLRPGGRLIIKDVEDTPAHKRWFTWVLDKMMDPHADVHYWGRAEIGGLLSAIGFRTHVHSMVDVLPYPHLLYVCTRPANDEAG